MALSDAAHCGDLQELMTDELMEKLADIIKKDPYLSSRDLAAQWNSVQSTILCSLRRSSVAMGLLCVGASRPFS